MKKIGKKIVALVMAMVMTLAICTSVFAEGTTPPSVTVKVQIQGTSQIEETVTIAEIVSALNSRGVEHFYTTQPFTNYQEDGVKSPTVADALIYAYNKYYQGMGVAWTDAYYDEAYETTYTSNNNYELSYAWDKNYYNKDTVDEKIPGIYFLYFDGITTANESYTPTSDGKTLYSSDSWLLTVNGTTSDYASSVALSNNDQIIFNYVTQSFVF